MIIYLFLIITIFFSFKIILNTGIERFIWFLIGICFIRNINIITTPGISVHRFLLVAFIISIMYRWEYFLKLWKEFPLHKILFILIITHLLVGMFDTRITIFYKFYKPLISYIETYLPFFLGYISIKEEKDFLRISRIFVLVSIIYCVYGFMVYVIKFNPYDFFLTNAVDEYNVDFRPDAISERGLRLNSFFADSHIYGFVLSIFFIVIISLFRYQLNYRLTVAVLLLIFINLILSGSRSSLLATLIGVILFVNYTSNFVKKIKLSFAFSLLIIAYCIYVPINLLDVFKPLIDMFTYEGGTSGGSSMQLREQQLMASIELFWRNPLFGNGFGFFRENILPQTSVFYNPELAGMESYIFELLIEQGIIQASCIFIFVFQLFRYFIKNKNKSILIFALGIALSSSFWINAFATGPYGKWIFSASIIGMCIKLLQLPNQMPEDI
jgi:hypothetical protein